MWIYINLWPLIQKAVLLLEELVSTFSITFLSLNVSLHQSPQFLISTWSLCCWIWMSIIQEERARETLGCSHKKEWSYCDGDRQGFLHNLKSLCGQILAFFKLWKTKDLKAIHCSGECVICVWMRKSEFMGRQSNYCEELLHMCISG